MQPVQSLTDCNFAEDAVFWRDFMTKLLDRIARFTVTRKLRSLLIGLAFIVLLGAAVGAFGGELADDWKIPGAESDKAYTLLQDKFPAEIGRASCRERV